MTTPASPLSVQDFASRIRAKFPGSYDSIPDDELAKRIVAKHPEYQDKVSFGAAPAAQTGGQGQGAPSASAATSPQQMPSGSDWLHAAGLPASMAEAQTTPGQALKMGASNVLHAADPTYLFRRVAWPMAKEGGRAAKGIFEKGGIPDPVDLIHAGSAVNPFAAPVVNQMSELRERGKEGEATATGLLGAGTLALGETLPKAVQYFKPGLPETAHSILGNAATRVKQTVGQGGPVYQAVSDHFGKLTNDIAAADYASGKKIPMNDIWEKALEHADDYAAGKTTPKFNAIVDEIQKRPVELTWKELHDLQQNVDKVTSAAAEGSRDAGAANQMRAAIAKKLDAKAAEVGRGEQWDAAKTIWRSLKEYQGDGVLKKLLNTGTEPVAPGGVSEGGKQFFDVLTDPANKAKLSEINKGFESYGLPADYFKNVAKTHAPLHDYLGMQEGSISRLQMLRKNPLAAIPGLAIGAGAGAATGIPAASFLGGTAGAVAGVKGAARMGAVNALERLGGAPEIASPMTEAAKVRPVGTGEKPVPPAAAPGAVNMNELTDALKSLGYKKEDAASLARMGMAEFPNDFNKALNRAMQGPQAALKNQSATAVTQSSKLPQYLRETIQQDYATAQRLGIADDIEELSAQGLTAKQVTARLKDKFGVTPIEDQAQIVRSTRAARGIPSQDNMAEFEAWRKARDIQKVKSVSGGSQAATSGPEPGSGTYSRDPRTQKQMLEDIRALKEGGRTLRKDK